MAFLPPNLTSEKIMISLEKYAPTNFVPAVAVIRRGRVLSVMTGRKGRVGCISVDGGAVITGGGNDPEKPACF